MLVFLPNTVVSDMFSSIGFLNENPGIDKVTIILKLADNLPMNIIDSTYINKHRTFP